MSRPGWSPFATASWIGWGEVMKIASNVWSGMFVFVIVSFGTVTSISTITFLYQGEFDRVTDSLYLMRSPLGIFFGLSLASLND